MGLFGHFYLSSLISLLFPSLWETTRYRLKYRLKGPLNLTNIHVHHSQNLIGICLLHVPPQLSPEKAKKQKMSKVDSSNIIDLGPEVIKLFSYSTQLSIKF